MRSDLQNAREAVEQLERLLREKPRHISRARKKVRRAQTLLRRCDLVDEDDETSVAKHLIPVATYLELEERIAGARAIVNARCAAREL